MAAVTTVGTRDLTEPVTLTIPAGLFVRLQQHLFPGDGDEHGAVVAAGLASTPRGTRLLARELILAEDGRDYVPGQHGYRMLTAAFVRDAALHCRDAGLAYLAVHNHEGTDRVGFSSDDIASHQRGYPALIDVLRGRPVGALVFARKAVAGDIWWRGGRVPLGSATVLGRAIHTLRAAPPPTSTIDPTYNRQSRLVGDRGQAILRQLHVGIIGAGGVGSLLSEYVARLGVGRVSIVDPDRLEESNLPRIIDAAVNDLHPVAQSNASANGLAKRIAAWLPLKRSITALAAGDARPTPKVTVAERVARRANPHGVFTPVFGDFLDCEIATAFTQCDYLFLAADSMQCRLLYNAITQQYLIPGIQVGSKVQVEYATGKLLDVFSVVRPATPGGGCLWCNGLIPPSRLQEEAATQTERQAQRYVDDPAVAAPSVITLNAVGASYAANSFLFGVTGLADDHAGPLPFARIDPRSGEMTMDELRADPDCPECSTDVNSRFARGDDPHWPLPTREARQQL